MNKKNFLEQLEQKLERISKKEMQEALSFYRELIEDAIEDGKKESEIIEELGNIDAIVQKIVEDSSHKKEASDSIKNRKMSAERMILMIVLSPFILTLFLVFFSLILALYAFIISFYIVGFTLLLISIPYFIDFWIQLFEHPQFALLEIGIASLSIGLAIACLKGTNRLFKIAKKLSKESYVAFLSIVKGENI